VLAATEHLHLRITGLKRKVRQLEDELSALHAKHSSDPHPLLHVDLIQLDAPDGDAGTASDEEMEKMSEDALDALGTLSMSDFGVSQFFGQTGGSEVRFSTGFGIISLILLHRWSESSPSSRL
jgi:hypothetical protein